MSKAGFRFKPFKRELELDDQHTKPAGTDLREEDITDQLSDGKFSALFLGSFEIGMIRDALDRFGITEQLAKKNYVDLEILFKPRGPFEHFLRIFDRSQTDHPLLGEIILKESRYTLIKQYLASYNLHSLSLLNIEWTLMQDIHGSFTNEHRCLPGQNYPGLGVGNRLVALLSWVAEIMHKDGLMNVPEYFHNAVFYDKWFKFIDPETQGTMERIFADLSAKGFDICDISFAVYFDCLINEETGESFLWTPHEQVLPTSDHLRDYFLQPAYKQLAKKRYEEIQIGVNMPVFEEKNKTAATIEW